METRHRVHNLIILDESGSMESIKEFIISGFNELVQNIKGIQEQYPEQEHIVSLVSFNGKGNKVIHFNEPVSSLESIDGSRYKPGSMTPLFDAMGFSIAKLRKVLEKEAGYHVLVTILTDGEENASREYSGNAIKKLVDELKALGWTFTYIGTEHNVEDFAARISITNSMVFNKNQLGLKNMFANENKARMNYSRNIRDNKDTRDGFYENGDEEAK
jgi:hypothetical protein